MEGKETVRDREMPKPLNFSEAEEVHKGKTFHDYVFTYGWCLELINGIIRTNQDLEMDSGTRLSAEKTHKTLVVFQAAQLCNTYR